MAEIPVEKKSDFPWWLLLIGALLLGLLLWMFFANDNDADVVQTRTAVTQVNSAISLDDAVVTDVTGDMSFYVRADNGERYYVVFDETPTPDMAKEGRLDINTGNVLDIDGMIRDRGYTMPATVDASIPSGVDTFIFATNIDK